MPSGMVEASSGCGVGMGVGTDVRIGVGSGFGTDAAAMGRDARRFFTTTTALPTAAQAAMRARRQARADQDDAAHWGPRFPSHRVVRASRGKVSPEARTGRWGDTLRRRFAAYWRPRPRWRSGRGP